MGGAFTQKNSSSKASLREKQNDADDDYDVYNMMHNQQSLHQS
jgi:hypothetical protein